MKILSFDTTNSLASVAIVSNEILLCSHVTKTSSLQAESLFSLISSCLTDTALSLGDIDLVSITNGPGSFTGVRIGLSAALGMRMHCRAKFIALTNFQVMAYHAKDQNKAIAVLLDARRDQLYYQLFDAKLKALNEASLVNISEFLCPAEVIYIGEGVKYFPKADILQAPQLDAIMLAKASEYFFDSGSYSDLKPLYIREPDAVSSKL